ncbi:MAG: hypothetical protein HC916_16500 [Coleofasciculaceae cyanobacterium SM2_1_6]|nr:hypothetical protein [Coleofasciculaceae cyanobacterium SM2_1_6]
MSSQQLSSLLCSGPGLVEVIIVVFYVAFIPSIISTDSVAVKTIVQPRIEIADNSKPVAIAIKGMESLIALYS